VIHVITFKTLLDLSNMTQNLTPHLLIEVDDSLLTPTIRQYLNREGIELDRGIDVPAIFVITPVKDEEDQLLIECTSEKFVHVIVTTAVHLERSQFKYRFSDLGKLYRPSYPEYHYYVKLMNLSYCQNEITVDPEFLESH